MINGQPMKVGHQYKLCIAKNARHKLSQLKIINIPGMESAPSTPCLLAFSWNEGGDCCQAGLARVSGNCGKNLTGTCGFLPFDLEPF
jgi:hypothetical protein